MSTAQFVAMDEADITIGPVDKDKFVLVALGNEVNLVHSHDDEFDLVHGNDDKIDLVHGPHDKVNDARLISTPSDELRPRQQ